MSEMPRSEQLARAMVPVLLVGAVGTGASIALGLAGIFAHTGGQFFRSWLFAWIFWLGVSLGCMAIVMLHHLTGGGWGYMVRRFGETAALVTPLMLLLFIPIIIGVRAIYPWAQPHVTDPVTLHKSAYLNLPFWTIRAVGYLIVFSALAWLLRTGPLMSDRVGTPESLALMTRQRRVSAGGFVIYFFLMGLASVDWIMSREPHWYSTVFGFIVCIAQAVSGCCFLILMLWIVADDPPFKAVVHPNYFNDLGNVLITFVILWAYLSFAQFLVTWLGNSQQEITWYIQRTDGGWRWVGGALISLHFFVPFMLLLQQPLKRKLGRLAAIAAGLFFIHIIDELYWVTPADPHVGRWPIIRWIYIEAMNVCAFVGVGGLWMAAYLWIQKGTLLLPIGERVPVMPVDHGHGQRAVPGPVD